MATTITTGSNTTVTQPKAVDPVTDFFRSDINTKAKDMQRQQCVANGGVWDEATGTCKRPMPTPEEVKAKVDAKNQEMQAQEAAKPNGSYDAAKGGFTTNDGQFYPTSNPNFVPGKIGAITPQFNGYQNIEDQKKFQTYDTQVQQVEQQQQQQAALQNLGLSETQIAAINAGVVESPIDFGQALTAGGAKILPSAIAGAAGGAAVGLLGGPAAPVTSTAGAIIGGVGGLIAGLISGVLSNIKSQQSGEIGASQDVLTSAKVNMRKLSSIAAKDPGNAAVYINAYNQQLAQVYRARAKIKLETTGNLNKFMEDGTDILSDFDLFLQPNGQADIYKQQLQMSLISGVPPALTVEDFAE